MTTFEKLQLDEMITQMVVYLVTNIKKKKTIVTDLIKHRALDPDPKIIQQVTWNCMNLLEI